MELCPIHENRLYCLSEELHNIVYHAFSPEPLIKRERLGNWANDFYNKVSEEHRKEKFLLEYMLKERKSLDPKIIKSQKLFIENMEIIMEEVLEDQILGFLPNTL